MDLAFVNAVAVAVVVDIEVQELQVTSVSTGY